MVGIDADTSYIPQNALLYTYLPQDSKTWNPIFSLVMIIVRIPKNKFPDFRLTSQMIQTFATSDTI